MATRDARIDAYIGRAGEFAKPILTRLRETIHEACPDVEEGWKWSCPHFLYHGMLCGMAAFKEHCAFGFWKGSLVVPAGDRGADAMGQFGRITKVSELPPKRLLIGYLRKAMQLNEQGVNLQRARPRAKRPVVVPDVLRRALSRNKTARSTFENFSPSHQREYVEWISEAQTAETRQRRLDTAIGWMAEGKPRHWKYLK
jgi:uncharacterized protein YdeI (YjbR/CyaY-like superfamily)